MNSIIINNTSSMNRPIQLVDRKPFFATNIPIRDDNQDSRNIWVVSSADFSEKYSECDLEGHKPFKEAPFHIDLAGIPKPGSTLSAEGYQRYVLDGEQLPEMGVIFREASQSISSFVAFDGSFASQIDMADFLACWAISTYATDIFDAVGYVWPNGERGSGKTQCLKTIMQLSFMGQTITSGSSFASVRDEASLGATIGFDDCENLRRMDQEKRELLLAGNTKGSGFMHKEPGKRDGSWITKYIDCFAPRAFTSIETPDEVLASRTILVPLVRTGDAAKTRRKPTNERDWATAPRTIRDAIWLLVCKDLLLIERAKQEVNKSCDLSGRDFDIFQAPLAIARWLETSHGVDHLSKRMMAVMEAYHATKQRNLLPSFENLVLQALTEMLGQKGATRYSFKTQDISFGIQEVCRNMDITDEELKSADVQKVGMLLSRLGFTKSKAHGTQRKWDISQSQVLEKAKTAGLTLEPIEVAESIEPDSSDTYLEPTVVGWPSPPW